MKQKSGARLQEYKASLEVLFRHVMFQSYCLGAVSQGGRTTVRQFFRLTDSCRGLRVSIEIVHHIESQQEVGIGGSLATHQDGSQHRYQAAPWLKPLEVSAAG